MPPFRSLMVVRLLSMADPALYDFENDRDIGEYAELGLWLLTGLPTDKARDAAKSLTQKQHVDELFAALITSLPAAVAERDAHGIVEHLTNMNIAPLCAQNVEHMLCEFRKMSLPSQRAHRGEPYVAYAELWTECAPMFVRRAA